MHGFRIIALGISFASMLAVSQQGRAFSLGVRAGAGMEMLTMSGVKLTQKSDGQQITGNEDIERSPIQFGAELVVTPVQFGNLGLSALVGFRGTSASVEGSFSDDRQFNFLPIGLSLDYNLGSLRLSGLGSFDLGLSPKFSVSSADTNTTADLEVANLSRLRFGFVGEYFIFKGLSVFAGGELITGSYDSGPGELSVSVNDPNSETPTVIDVAVAEAKNKIFGFGFGAGVAYTYSLSSSESSKVTKEVRKQGKKVRKRLKRKRKPRR